VERTAAATNDDDRVFGSLCATGQQPSTRTIRIRSKTGKTTALLGGTGHVVLLSLIGIRRDVDLAILDGSLE
jgi:hypothetical protein